MIELSTLKNLPPIYIDHDELVKVPVHKRVNYVMKKYLSDGNILEKTAVIKYFADALFGIVSSIGTPTIKKYVDVLKGGISLFELNTVFSNIIRVEEIETEYYNKSEALKEVLKDNFFECHALYSWDDNNESIKLIMQNITKTPASVADKYNLKIIAKDEVDDMFSTESVIVAELNDVRFAIYFDAMSVVNGYATKTRENFNMFVPWHEDEDSYIANARAASIITALNKICIEVFCHRIKPDENYVTIDKDGYQIHTKKPVPEEIRNIDYDDLVSSIEYCVEHNKKRGIAIVGDPGLGKSLMIYKIINHFNTVPTFIVRNEALLDVYSIRHVFNMVKDMKAILVIDDFDGLEVSHKGPVTNEFLHQLDANGTFKGVIIATVNDPSKVHYTLIARPERFDEVHLMRYPETIEEIEEIVENKLKNINELEFLASQTKGPDYIQFLAVCAKNKFTHARVSSAIDYCLAHFREITSSGLLKASTEMLRFQENARLFSDNGELKAQNARNHRLYTDEKNRSEGDTIRAMCANDEESSYDDDDSYESSDCGEECTEAELIESYDILEGKSAPKCYPVMSNEIEEIPPTYTGERY